METDTSNIIVSVIIPIYNVEDYLRQCIDSVLYQTYRNLEIILVDDGSTDKSGKIAEKYSELDSRIVVIHKDNGGLSDARNTGTSIAKGKYVFYLDSDDYIGSTAIEQLVTFAESNDCEIVQGGFYYLYPEYLLFDKWYGSSNNSQGVISKLEAMEYLINNTKIKNFAWGKLYLKSLVEKHQFPVDKYFEDSFWQYKIVNECKKYGIINDPLTYYRQREGSISCNGINTKILDLIDGNINRTQFIKIHYPDLYPVAIQSLWRSVYDICYSNSRTDSAFRKKLESTITEYHNEFKEFLPILNEYTFVKRKHTNILLLIDLAKRIIAKFTINRFTTIKIN